MVPGGASARQQVSIGWQWCGGASTAQLSKFAAAGREADAGEEKGDVQVDLARLYVRRRRAMFGLEYQVEPEEHVRYRE